MTYKDNVKAILEANYIGFNEEYLDAVCEKICEIQLEKTYEDGLNDAWECAKKVMFAEYEGGLSINEHTEIFGNIIAIDVMKNYTASEVIAKIKEYEEQKNEIKQWDEIYNKSNPQNKLIVVGISAWDDWHCVDNEGHVFKIDNRYKKNWMKTGKSYPELANILEQLNGDKE